MRARHSFRSRLIHLLALLAVLGLVAAACGSGDDESGGPDTTDGPTGETTPDGGSDEPSDPDEGMEPQTGGSIVFAVEADSDGYHPVDNRWSISGNYVGSSIYEPLMVEVGDGSLEPWLAESVTPNDDATEWTIGVRDGIEFHDGSPLDAEVVALNIAARQEGALTGPANEPIESVEAVDDTTVVVTMKRPWAAYDHSLAAVGGYMAAKSMLEEGGDRSEVIGTGPFTFVSWTTEVNLIAERNENYWRDPAYLDRIEFQFVPDVITRTLAMRSGDVDAIITPQPDAIVEFRNDDSIDIYEHASEPFHILLNSAAEPFDDPLTRQILAHGTNPELIISLLGGEDVLTPATSAFVPGNPWHLEDNGYPEYDLDRARELHDEYEAANGQPLTFEMQGSAGQEAALAGALIEQWSAVGADVSYGLTEQSVFLFDVISGNYSAGLWRNHNWVDPDFNYIFWHSSNSNPIGEVSINFTHLEVDELDEALERGRGTLDADVRRAAYDDVQRILNEQLTHIWLYEQVWGLAAKTEVRGWGDLIDRGLSRLEPKVVWADVWVQQ